ncbi:helix-turn-helix domain-containing protein [Actinophytocola sp.]|uniref:helix-turn-helix domain-containing protein n=1 Tax=Actinophytocola sp. TaxID=1872138 RepID=UPI00389A50D3
MGQIVLNGWRQPWDLRLIVELRERRGWTQEKLAERSGLSVRTIRNLELGIIQNPRQSSIDLLAHALGMPGERQAPGTLDRARWRGPQPPGSPVVGNRSDHEVLAHTVRTNRLTTLFGAGGVGKTRFALSVAAEVGPFFRHGVVVVELGDLVPETRARGSRAATVLHRVRQHLCRDAESGTPGPGNPDTNALVVLDNAEHLPDGVTAAAKELLGTFPRTHVLVTTRRRLTERMGVNREIHPLAHEPAVELVLRHVSSDAWAAVDLTKDVKLVTELCRRLGGVPRYLEFAAERMRAIPLRHLLTHGPGLEMLSSNDHALLPHQRSVADSIRWNLDLLSDEHRGLLARIAAMPVHRFTMDHVVALTGHQAPASTTAGPFTLLSDLLELSLILTDPDDRYRYHLAPYVAEVIGQPGCLTDQTA